MCYTFCGVNESIKAFLNPKLFKTDIRGYPQKNNDLSYEVVVLFILEDAYLFLWDEASCFPLQKRLWQTFHTCSIHKHNVPGISNTF